MAIRREQPGAAKAAAAAGTAIGQARRAEEDRARAEREQARAAAEAERKQARAAAEAMQKQARQDEIKFAMQKRQVDWQRALDKERRQEDYQLAAEDRAVERGFAAADYTAQKSLERIEFGKDLDFQYKTQERQRKVGEFDNQISALNKAADDQLVDRDFAWQDKMSRLVAGRDAAMTDTPYRELSDEVSEQRAESRETRAASAEQRAQESAERAQAAVPTAEAVERDQNVTILGSWAKDLSLPEQRDELAALGLTPQSRNLTNDPNDVPALSPEELKEFAVGKSEAERQTIYERGVQLGYWE